MYQVPGWGSIGMGELPSVGAQEIGAGEKPGWSAQFFKLKIERPESLHLRPELYAVGLYVAGLKVELVGRW